MSYLIFNALNKHKIKFIIFGEGMGGLIKSLLKPVARISFYPKESCAKMPEYKCSSLYKASTVVAKSICRTLFIHTQLR